MDLDSDEWIELNHPIDADVAKVPFLPVPSFARIDDASLQATEVSLATHVGTHLEAPRHLREGGRTIDDYPAGKWIGRGLVCEVAAEPLERIEVEQIDPPAEPREGDALLLRTGWEDHVGEERYYEQPYLSEAAAEWVVDAGFGWLGIDSPSPEMPVQLREEPFDYPVHSALLDSDVPIAEHVTGLAAVAGEVVDVVALPLRYVDSDGAQARIVARPR
jgi:kynurenine formamidase